MKSLFLIFGLFVLTACGASNTQGDFLCAAQDGMACATMAQADGLTDVSGRSIAERNSDTLTSDLSQQPLVGGKGKAGTLGTGLRDGGAGYNPSNYRTPEILGTMWIAPYLDDDNVFHEATRVHFVIRESQWGRS